MVETSEDYSSSSGGSAHTENEIPHFRMGDTTFKIMFIFIFLPYCCSVKSLDFGPKSQRPRRHLSLLCEANLTADFDVTSPNLSPLQRNRIRRHSYIVTGTAYCSPERLAFMTTSVSFFRYSEVSPRWPFNQNNRSAVVLALCRRSVHPPTYTTRSIYVVGTTLVVAVAIARTNDGLFPVVNFAVWYGIALPAGNFACTLVRGVRWGTAHAGCRGCCFLLHPAPWFFLSRDLVLVAVPATVPGEHVFSA